MVKNVINGEHVLYHYLQKDLNQKDIWLFQMLTSRLVASLGIWLSPEIYKKLPIMVPYARRDHSCRKKKGKNIEEWGSPDDDGFFRDDNSLLKNIPGSLDIDSPLDEIYNGKRIGTGFVASHVWRFKDGKFPDNNMSTRDSKLYSFVPNVVWLPSEVSKLTDREGSFTQQYLQALSYKIYREIPLNSTIQPYVEEAWSRLPIPEGIPSQGLPEVKDLNYFNYNVDFIKRRYKKIRIVKEALEEISSGNLPIGKIISYRYTEGLPELGKKSTRKITLYLGGYLKALESSIEC